LLGKKGVQTPVGRGIDAACRDMAAHEAWHSRSVARHSTTVKARPTASVADALGRAGQDRSRDHSRADASRAAGAGHGWGWVRSREPKVIFSARRIWSGKRSIARRSPTTSPLSRSLCATAFRIWA